ncbi:MAG: acyl-CoA/acyl-ACP dehydrogenase [Thermoplasmata archaeon]|uniref:Acyl-CoA/acyl-ACP dehydrogenase n=1 Tax=Candidatus Sysuiplasma superficiale TaxID=2823368 RepID=A0A8J7YMH9_9ARCH|nr:acyl-CoA/acyl-ACP dehydrogenase [Candidatus Sysuiplasma superficiale]MBX8643513.1 acyl-CoA/acyl-ACP dehydrogenase [Candidatus Sysuiplasma superficiale]
MNFSLSEEEKLFQSTAHEFLKSNLAPIAREIDTEHRIPEDVLRKMGDLGILGTTIPERYGGPGGTMTMASIAAMEVGAADPSMATAVYFLLVTGWSHLTAKLGSEELRQSLLPEVAKGRRFLGIATTEPGGGSDLAAMKTNARKEKGRLVLNGEKIYISGVSEAKRTGGGHLTLMKTDPALKHRGLTFAYVPINSGGIETSVLQNMGRMGISTGIISYRDVDVPEGNIIGEYNKGFFHAMLGFNYARTLVSAACVGAAQWALETGADYIKKRSAFGSPLAKYEAVSFEYADLAVQIEMVRNQVLKAATLLDEFDRGGDVSMRDINIAVSSCKLTAPPLALEAVKKVMMWHGALSYTKDTLLEMALRGVLSYVVGAEGALNIMRLVIVRELLGPEYLPYR